MTSLDGMCVSSNITNVCLSHDSIGKITWVRNYFLAQEKIWYPHPLCKKYRIYTRGLWKRITIFLQFSCKPYMRLKSYSQVLMCNPELVWISFLFDCTITRRCWWRHMGTYNIQHLSAQINENFWLSLCLNCGVYDAMLPKTFIDFF